MPLFGASNRNTWRIGTLLAFVVVAVSVHGLSASGSPFYPGAYTVDLFSQLLKVTLAVGLALVMLLSGELPSIRGDVRSDVPTFLYLGTAGMMLLVSATELLTLYVALEMSAYSLFILVGLGPARKRGTEAAARYVLFGAAASALTLYGLSLVYGATGTTFVAAIAAQPVEVLQSPLFILGVVFALGGLLFKLAAFPVHRWVPDVYEGAPHQAVTFLATASKVAAVGVLARVLSLIWSEPGQMSTALWVLCVLSMTFGNLAALRQKSIKRLLGYSAIAHAGYLLIGLQTFTQLGTASALFYAIVYMVMGFCPFLVVCVLAKDDNPTLESLHGLHARSPLLALVLLLGMFGLAGVPPTPGFVGKWFLFTAAVDAEQFWLVLVAAINATIGLYYYLQVVRAAYVSGEGGGEPIRLGPAITLAALLVILLTLWTGIYPTHVWDLSKSAAAVLVGA